MGGPMADSWGGRSIGFLPPPRGSVAQPPLKRPPSFQHGTTLPLALLLVKPLATDTDRPGASSFTECGVRLSECLCEEPRARTVTRGWIAISSWEAPRHL